VRTPPHSRTTPSRRARVWFWLTVGCAPLAYAAYAVTELLGVGATPARRRTGGLGFVIGCLLAIGLAVSADTLRSTFGVHLPL
jgi:hypothetical protein